MKLISFLILLFSIMLIHGSVQSQELITPQKLGLNVKHGQIDKSKMSSRQKDTIIIEQFTIEDIFLDIAVYYKSKNEIAIYKNCVNGYLTELKIINLNKKAIRIEADSPTDKDLLFNPNLRAGIKIFYEDGTNEKISNYRINKFSDEPEPKVPLWNFLDDARAFVYDISFIEVWRSERNGTPAREIAIGDIDNDGKNEMVFTFWPVSDSIPINYPTRIVVFESVGNNQYRIDWDTTLTLGGYNKLPYITDFDRDGNKEFFGAGWDGFRWWL